MIKVFPLIKNQSHKFLDKSCWRTEQCDATQSPVRGACRAFQYSCNSGLTIDTHTCTHTCTHTRQWVYSYILSLHSVKGKISIPDLHKYTQTHLGDSLLGCFWLQGGSGKSWRIMLDAPLEQFIYPECED